MAVVNFDPERARFAISGAERFFFTSTGRHIFHLLPATCPHRGGPLHLGRLDTGACTIRCPWHDTEISLRCLQSAALPLIVRPGNATVILPSTGDEPIAIDERIILATFC